MGRRAPSLHVIVIGGEQDAGIVSSRNVRFLLRSRRLEFRGGALQGPSAGHGALGAVGVRRKARPSPIPKYIARQGVRLCSTY